MTSEVVYLPVGHPRYEELTAHLREEPLRTQWWNDAESEHMPHVSYVMVLAEDAAGRMVPAAWAGWYVKKTERVLKCCSNYVRHGFRDQSPDLYEVAYRERHLRVVLPLGLQAETFVFPEPVDLHLGDGWRKDDSNAGRGVSRAYADGPVHYWRRLTWSPLEPGTRRSVPVFCPRCGEPEPLATGFMMWCGRCPWEQSRER